MIRKLYLCDSHHEHPRRCLGELCRLPAATSVLSDLTLRVVGD
jgi:hypothetical protein